MCKKIGIAAIAVVAGLFVLNHTKLGDWAKYAFHHMKDKIQSQVPPEVVVEKLKFELTQLDPEIEKNKDALAEQKVAVRELKAQIETTRAKLEKKEADIQRAVADVDKGVTRVSYNGRQLASLEAKEAILADKKLLKQGMAMLEAKEKLLVSKQHAVSKAAESLANWQTTRATLEAKIQQIEADLAAVREAQKHNDIHFDNTRLSRFEESLSDLDRTVKVLQERLALDNGEFVKSAEKSDKTEAVEREWRAMQDDEKPGKVASEK